MDKKEIEKAIDILINHNKWRKGGDNEMSEPKDLTFAIDTVIEALSQPKEVDLQKPVESDAVEFAEWFEKSGWIKCSDNGMYYSTNFTEYFGKYIIRELYEQFKQLKK